MAFSKPFRNLTSKSKKLKSPIPFLGLAYLPQNPLHKKKLHNLLGFGS